MNTDDTDPGNPSSLKEPWPGGQPQVFDQELDPYGVPVLVRPARDRAYLLAAGGLIFAGVSELLAVVDYGHRLSGYLVSLGMLSAVLAIVLGTLLEKRRKGKQLGWVIQASAWVAYILALLGISGLLPGT
jgi:hypothetical protein